MPTFIAVYRGKTIADARLISASSDPGIVSEVVARLLSDEQREIERASDPVLRPLAEGRRDSLRLIVEGQAGEE